MLKLLTASLAVTVAYLCEHPSLIGRGGIELQLRKHHLAAWLAKRAYCSASAVYELIHRSPPNTSIDQLARFDWLHDRDIELVADVQKFLQEVRDLETAEVPAAHTEEYTAMFDDMKASCPTFTKWHDLGFQGQNPATDFRGAGKLGVVLFHNFCVAHTARLNTILQESRSGTEQAADEPWYPLALVSIRLTNALCELLRREKLIVVKLLQQQKTEQAWFALLQNIHNGLLEQFHQEWLQARTSGEVQRYFDNELVLKRFEEGLPMAAYNLNAN